MPPILPADRDAVTAICLLAAMADGTLNAAEQARIQVTVASLAAADGGGGAGGGTFLPGADVYQRVMLGQADPAREAAAISSPDLRRHAYELAVAVCAADGVTSAAERAFLTKLAPALGVGAADAGTFVSQADQLAAAAGGKMTGGSTSGVGSGSGAPSASELDDLITNAAILNGALELLPHALASMAIIPLQMRLVYRIGARYGYSLDRGHIAEFLGVFGIGATSQMVESVAGRLIGGLLGGIGRGALGGLAGGVAGSLGRTVGGSAVAFASTYALGQVARQYYAGGRTLSAVDLKSLFSSNLGAAQGLVGKYLPQIQQRAGSLNPMQLVSLVRDAV